MYWLSHYPASVAAASCTDSRNDWRPHSNVVRDHTDPRHWRPSRAPRPLHTTAEGDEEAQHSECLRLWPCSGPIRVNQSSQSASYPGGRLQGAPTVVDMPAAGVARYMPWDVFWSPVPSVRCFFVFREKG